MNVSIEMDKHRLKYFSTLFICFDTSNVWIYQRSYCIFVIRYFVVGLAVYMSMNFEYFDGLTLSVRNRKIKTI